MELSLGTTFNLKNTSLVFPGRYEPRTLVDVSRNKMGDIVFRSKSAGKFIVWYMSGITRTAYNSHTAPASAVLVARGDFNGDGFGDLGWMNPSTKDVTVSLSSSTISPIPSSPPSHPPRTGGRWTSTSIDPWSPRSGSRRVRGAEGLSVLLLARAGAMSPGASRQLPFRRSRRTKGDSIGRPHRSCATRWRACIQRRSPSPGGSERNRTYLVSILPASHLTVMIEPCPSAQPGTMSHRRATGWRASNT